MRSITDRQTVNADGRTELTELADGDRRGQRKKMGTDEERRGQNSRKR